MQSALHKVIGPKEVHPENLDGCVAIVTGGAFGIGLEVSAALAGAGCSVIMVNRKEEHGNEAVEEIRKRHPGARVSWEGCDMGDLAQTKQVFSRFREGDTDKKLDRLDFLVLAAGISVNQYDEDKDGIDRHFGVNYLGQYLAVNQLWPLLRKTSRTRSTDTPASPAPRIVFLSSELHRLAPLSTKFQSLEEINDPKIDPTQLYARSKLALLLLAKYGLAGKVIKENGDRIYAVSVHPGTVNTSMQQQWEDAYPGITGKLLKAALLSAGRDLKQGSYSTLWALTSPDIEEKNMNGYYFTDPGQAGKESSQGSDPELGEALWNLSAKLVEEKLGDGALVDWNSST